MKEENRKEIFKTNTDTDFLKLIAIMSMLTDHIGAVFFPEQQIFRCIGRLAFPLFCYCMTVGLVYTHDIKRYILRLAVFAVISQPFYIMAFNPQDFIGNITNWNIFFTLVISLISMYGFKEKKWWLFALGFFVVSWWNFDYSANGILLMLIFYCFRKKPVLGAFLFVLFYIPCLFGGDPANPMCITLGQFVFNRQVFALLAAPLIFFTTSLRPKISKWVFYSFYPAHLGVIAIARFIMRI